MMNLFPYWRMSQKKTEHVERLSNDADSHVIAGDPGYLSVPDYSVINYIVAVNTGHSVLTYCTEGKD